MLPAQPNQSLIDGLTVLQALAGRPEGAGVRELARHLSLETTRANRLLMTLAHLGMARRTADRKYLPGPAMHVLSVQSMFGSGLLRRALKPLEKLQKLGLTVALGVVWQDQVCYLYHGTRGMKAQDALGRVGLFPAAQSSIGMVLLAAQDDKEIRKLFAGREIPNFSGSLNDFLRQLRIIRENGYARLRTPGTLKDSTMAVPIGCPPYAAVALQGRIAEKSVKKMVAILRAAADEIGQEPTPSGMSQDNE